MVEVTVCDQYGVECSDIFEVVGAGRVGLHPGIDHDPLAAGCVIDEGGVSIPCDFEVSSYASHICLLWVFEDIINEVRAKFKEEGRRLVSLRPSSLLYSSRG